MLQREISYEFLLLMRAGELTDDERIDFRLLDTLVDQYRGSYILSDAKNGNVNELCRQHTSFDLSLTSHEQYDRLETTEKIPRIMIGKQGPLIEEVYSPYVDEYPFTIVNRTALRYSGNGKFNESIIYTAYDNDKLYFKYKEDSYNLMDKISISAIFEKPSDVPGFDPEVDQYPLDLDGINFVKEMFMNSDIKLILMDKSDETNDATGDIR